MSIDCSRQKKKKKVETCVYVCKCVSALVHVVEWFSAFCPGWH